MSEEGIRLGKQVALAFSCRGFLRATGRQKGSQLSSRGARTPGVLLQCVML